MGRGRARMDADGIDPLTGGYSSGVLRDLPKGEGMAQDAELRDGWLHTGH